MCSWLWHSPNLGFLSSTLYTPIQGNFCFLMSVWFLMQGSKFTPYSVLPFKLKLWISRKSLLLLPWLRAIPTRGVSNLWTCKILIIWTSSDGMMQSAPYVWNSHTTVSYSIAPHMIEGVGPLYVILTIAIQTVLIGSRLHAGCLSPVQRFLHRQTKHLGREFKQFHQTPIAARPVHCAVVLSQDGP